MNKSLIVVYIPDSRELQGEYSLNASDIKDRYDIICINNSFREKLEVDVFFNPNQDDTERK
jgi:hypothetical protein